MAIYFGKERCDGNTTSSIAVEAATVPVNTYYNSETGIKIANVGGTDIYSPQQKKTDVDVKQYYTDATGTKIASVDGKDIYSPVSISNSVANVFVGQVIAYAGTTNTIPNGWLLCDGSAVSKSQYIDLWKVIGNSYGTCADKNKFLLPKLTDARYLQGYTIAGKPYEAGLPNIKGAAWSVGYYGATKNTCSGALSNDSLWQNSCIPDRANDNTEMDGTLIFDASMSNPIYGSSTTVTPKSLTILYLICWKAYIPTQLQIAMPNWNKQLIVDIYPDYKDRDYVVQEGGYVLFFESDDGKTAISWTGSVNENQVFFTARSSYNAYENTNQQLIPVSKNDIIKISGRFGINAKVQFIPCKAINSTPTQYDIEDLIQKYIERYTMNLDQLLFDVQDATPLWRTQPSPKAEATIKIEEDSLIIPCHITYTDTQTGGAINAFKIISKWNGTESGKSVTQNVVASVPFTIQHAGTKYILHFNRFILHAGEYTMTKPSDFVVNVWLYVPLSKCYLPKISVK